jgi:hypothetical protein
LVTQRTEINDTQTSVPHQANTVWRAP